MKHQRVAVTFDGTNRFGPGRDRRAAVHAKLKELNLIGAVPYGRDVEQPFIIIDIQKEP